MWTRPQSHQLKTFKPTMPPFHACEYLKAVSLLNIHAALLFQAKAFFEEHKCWMAGRKWSVRTLADVQPRIQLITAVSVT